MLEGPHLVEALGLLERDQDRRHRLHPILWQLEHRSWSSKSPAAGSSRFLGVHTSISTHLPWVVTVWAVMKGLASSKDIPFTHSRKSACICPATDIVVNERLFTKIFDRRASHSEYILNNFKDFKNPEQVPTMNKTARARVDVKPSSLCNQIRRG